MVSVKLLISGSIESGGYAAQASPKKYQKHGMMGTGSRPFRCVRQPNRRPVMEAIPNTVHERLNVCDVAMDDIGTVEAFRRGDEDRSRPGPETAGISPAVEDERSTPASILADVSTPDGRLPRETQERA